MWTPYAWNGIYGAALQLKDYINENNINARVIYFGCPAEEGGSGKAFMAKEGIFDEADIAITWHPFNGSGVMTGSMQANKQIYVTFLNSIDIIKIIGNINNKKGKIR